MQSTRTLAIALAALVLGAQGLRADPVTFAFGGDLTLIDDPSGLLGGATTFAGAYTFESLTPDADPDPTLGEYDAVTSVTLNIGTFSFTSATVFSGLILVGDSPGFDFYVASIDAQDISGASLAPELSLEDFTGTVFASDALPTTPPNLLAFQGNLFSATFDNGEVFFTVEGPITVIPEPAAASLCVLGLVLLGAGRRRIGRRRTA